MFRAPISTLRKAIVPERQARVLRDPGLSAVAWKGSRSLGHVGKPSTPKAKNSKTPKP